MKKIVLAGSWLITVLMLFIPVNGFSDFYDADQVNTIQLFFPQTNWDQLLDNLFAAGNEERLLGSAVINGVAFDSVGVRYKGNSSYSASRLKNPFNIKLDYIIDDQLLEGKYGTIKLANGFSDPSFVRETLSYEIARKYMPASKANYANVWVNGTLIGAYTNVQDVDSYFMETNLHCDNKPRFKCDTNSMGAITVWGYLGADSTAYSQYYGIESDYGWSDLIDFTYTLNNNQTNIANVMNVDQNLWMCAFDNLLVSLDSPINIFHNFYLFGDASGRINPILWDLNMTFGGFGGGAGGNITQMQQYNPLQNSTSSTFPLISHVISNARYKKMYIAHMRTMLAENFSNGWYATRAAELQAICGPSVQADPHFFYTYANFQANLNSSVSGGSGGPGGGTICGITQLMNTRATWLLASTAFAGTVPTITSVVCTTPEPHSNSTVNFTLTATNATFAQLGLRQDIADKFTYYTMMDDGAHNDGNAGDGVFGVSVEIGYGDLQFYGYAESATQGAFLPAGAEHDFFTLDLTTETGEIIINEINYNSSDEFDTGDWVELYNPGSSSLDISGWVFKDGNDDHIFTIPNGTTINSGGYLVLCEVSADFSTNFPNVSNYIGDFDFGLSSAGEALRLYDAENAIVDSVLYGNSDPWPLAPNGTGTTLELISPALDNSLGQNWQSSAEHGTPGALNGGGSVPVFGNIVINEINYGSSPDFNPGDWVELYNLDEQEVDISSWVFRDSDDGHSFVIPSGTVMPGHGYLVLCDSLAGFSALFPDVINPLGELGFGLSSAGELVRLYNNTGVIIDSLTYGVTAPWPSAPNGTGPTLVLISPALDNCLPASWAASSGHGTPGGLNTTTGAETNSLPVQNRPLYAYPNPFNPSTTITFKASEKSARTSLEVYNIKGCKVAVLTDGVLSKGEQSVVWNGLDDHRKAVGSGMYFIVLKYAGKTVSSRKIVLLK